MKLNVSTLGERSGNRLARVSPFSHVAETNGIEVPERSWFATSNSLTRLGCSCA